MDEETVSPALLNRANAEYARRCEDEKLRYVLLNPAIRRYAEAWVHPKSRSVVFAGANGVGKTYNTIAFLGWTIWPETAPPWFSKAIAPKIKEWPKAFRIASTTKEVEEDSSVQNAIQLLWPKGRYQAYKSGRRYDSKYRTDNGWSGDVMTYEQKPQEFEGGERSVIIFNEPPPEQIYTASISRTRMGGMMVFPGTPLLEAAWIKDKLVDKAPESFGGIQVVTGDIEEACIEHSVNGHLKHEEIERLIAAYDPDERDARTKGAFMHLAGRILKGFKRELFMSKEPLDFQEDAVKFQVIDPGGFNKPFSVIWGQIVSKPIHGIQILKEWPDGQSQLFEEMKSPNMAVKDYVQAFRDVEGMVPSNAIHRIIDKRFANVQDLRFGMSLKQHFSEEGLDFVDSYSVPGEKSEIKTGIEAIKGYFRIDAISNLPMFLIDPRCRNTMRAMERWSLDPKTLKPKDDVWKNFCDVVRYLCAAELKYEAPTPNEDWNSLKGPRY